MNCRAYLLAIPAVMLVVQLAFGASQPITQVKEAAPSSTTETDFRGTARSPLIVEVRPIPQSKDQTEQDRKDREARAQSDMEVRVTNSRLVLVGYGQLLVFVLQLAVLWYQATKLRQTVDAANAQADDTKRSIAEAARAATAMETLGQSMAASAKSASDSVTLQRVQIEEERTIRARQDFESTFFQLLHRFSEVVADMRVEYDVLAPDFETREPYKTVVKEGREAIRVLFALFEKSAKENPKPTGTPIGTYYEELYRDFYNQWQHELGIYFRTLYHIFRLVRDSGLSSADRAQYASIARAQLSAYELGLMFYNGLWDEGRTGFKPLIERYGILKHLKKETVLRETDLHDRNLYGETAFMDYEQRLKFWGGDEPSNEHG